MSLHHAVLSLLTAGSSHGYELKHAFESAVGPQWGTLNIGYLYQVLDRLSRDGLVTSERVNQPVKPDRVVYRITSAGLEELQRWMDAPTVRTGGFRNDLALKVMAAVRDGRPDVLSSVLSTQRVFLLGELRDLQHMLSDIDDDNVVVRLLLSAASRQVEADVAFLDDTERTLIDRR